MRSDEVSAFQIPLFVRDEVPWPSLPEEKRYELIELLAHLFKEEVKSEGPVIEEEARDV